MGAAGEDFPKETNGRSPTLGIVKNSTGKVGASINLNRRRHGIKVTHVVKEMQGVAVHKIGPSIVATGPCFQKGVKDVGAMSKEATKILQAEHTDMVTPFKGQTPGKCILVGVESLESEHCDSPRGGAHKVHMCGSHMVVWALVGNLESVWMFEESLLLDND